jgi:peptidoglycan/xylan/chitin deacetylase (PgdA/CDA1 family)
VNSALLPMQGLILLYHRVTEGCDDPYNICVTPGRFAEQIDHVRQRAEIVPLATLLDEPGEGRVAITFDDGYFDNAYEARAILEAAEAFATFFTVSGSIGSEREFWWDQLAYVLLHAPPSTEPVEVDLNPRISVRLQLDTLHQRMQSLWTIYLTLLARSPTSNERSIAALAARLGMDLLQRDSHRVMSVSELRALAASRWAEVGAHTESHPRLTSTSRSEQRKEIEESRSALERLLGRPIRAFAYPFGEYSNETVELVAEAGLDLACTVDPGRVNGATDRLRLPRHEVRDWTGAEFSQHFASWMAL